MLLINSSDLIRPRDQRAAFTQTSQAGEAAQSGCSPGQHCHAGSPWEADQGCRAMRQQMPPDGPSPTSSQKPTLATATAAASAATVVEDLPLHRSAEACLITRLTCKAEERASKQTEAECLRRSLGGVSLRHAPTCSAHHQPIHPNTARQC